MYIHLINATINAKGISVQVQMIMHKTVARKVLVSRRQTVNSCLFRRDGQCGTAVVRHTRVGDMLGFQSPSSRACHGILKDSWAVAAAAASAVGHLSCVYVCKDMRIG